MLLCFQAETFPRLTGATLSADVPSPFFQWAPQRSLYPTSATIPASADVASFLGEVFRMNTPPHKSLVDDVQEDRLFEVWRKNPGVIDQPTAFTSSDPALRSFAAGLPQHFQIVDLRRVDPGMGFSWGRYGPRTEVRRHGHERIFGYAKQPSTGFFAKLFGR